MSKNSSYHSTTNQEKPNTEARSSAINHKTWETLREDLGGNIDMLTQKFLQKLDGRTESILAAISVNDSEALRNEAHALKGTSATIGAELLSQLCRQLEECGKKNDFAPTEELKTLLLAEAKLVRDCLENIIKGQNKS
ncbi:MAG: Hpt domain-containing protein [Magnetococcales bacterium]|nr:Hpt domain-containing protein [Magnetococcales bacterium]